MSFAFIILSIHHIAKFHCHIRLIFTTTCLKNAERYLFAYSRLLNRKSEAAFFLPAVVAKPLLCSVLVTRL